MTDTWESYVPIRDTRLDLLKGAEWEAYYAKAAPFLLSAHAGVRDSIMERLMTAVFWAEGSGPRTARPTKEHIRRREAWLLTRVMEAHETQHDTIPNFLNHLRHNHPRDPQILGERLNKWARQTPPGVNPDHVIGAIILQSPAKPSQCSEWIKLLDAPSTYIRACAAYKLGAAIDLWAESEAEAMEIIFAKEIKRPGIAGPFWSGSDLGYDTHLLPIDASDWMMRILEQRSGPEPTGLPFNGIDFHAHEVCSYSPEMVRRMLRTGQVELALETALENRAYQPQMEDVLMELGETEHTARAHLAWYHGVRHPKALPTEIRTLADMPAGTRALATLREYEGAKGQTLRLENIALHPEGNSAPLQKTQIEALIDRLAPHALRGDMRPYPGLSVRSDPPAPYFIGDKELRSFTGRITVEIVWLPERQEALSVLITGPGLWGPNP